MKDGILIDGRVFLPSGSTFSPSFSGGGIDGIHQTPHDPRLVLRHKRIYWTERMKRAESDYERVKAALNGRGEPVSAASLHNKNVPKDGAEALEHLSNLVEECRNELETLTGG